MKRFTKTMAALGLAAVMGAGSAFTGLADVTTSVNRLPLPEKQDGRCAESLVLF